jgi:hypothetical protein
MTLPTFALFLDVMGVQDKLGRSESEPTHDLFMKECREMFELFHRDVDETLGREMDLLTASGELTLPQFIAEFSDSVYVVADDLGTLICTAVIMMRKALRHEYALRGGVGFGSFSHETSGSSMRRNGQIWSTSSFFGSAIVSAYQAERSKPLGLRVLLHPTVTAQLRGDDDLAAAAAELPDNETSVSAMDEVRIWSSNEAAHAKRRIERFRDKQNLTDRARRHYDATMKAYERFGRITADLPFDPPTMWIFSG